MGLDPEDTAVIDDDMIAEAFQIDGLGEDELGNKMAKPKSRAELEAEAKAKEEAEAKAAADAEAAAARAEQDAIDEAAARMLSTAAPPAEQVLPGFH